MPRQKGWKKPPPVSIITENKHSVLSLIAWSAFFFNLLDWNIKWGNKMWIYGMKGFLWKRPNIWQLQSRSMFRNLHIIVNGIKLLKKYYLQLTKWKKFEFQIFGSKKDWKMPTTKRILLIIYCQKKIRFWKWGFSHYPNYWSSFFLRNLGFPLQEILND